jgi:predicted RecB family nuclease
MRVKLLQEWEAGYPGRKFALGGNLVGSRGEVIAAEALDPELYGGMIVLSASDLTGHLHCRHLTALDVEVATGARPKPKVWDPVLELLAERGALHEASYVEHLRTGGSVVAQVSGKGVDSASVSETLNAMRSGVPVIVQGALQVGRWSGRADVLRRVETPSGLGPWSYEVIDTKLARETKGSTVLQLSLYSDLLGSLQGGCRNSPMS